MPIDALIDKIEFDPKQGREEIADMAAAFSELIVNVYDTILEATASDTVRDAVADLKKMEEREKILALRSTQTE